MTYADLLWVILIKKKQFCCFGYFTWLSKLQLNPSWVWHEDDSAHHHHPTPLCKLNVCIISAVTDPIWTKLQTVMVTFVQATFVHLTISAITQLNQFWQNYWTQFFGGQQFLDQHFVRPKMLLVICHALLGTLDMSILVFEYLLVNLDFSIFTLHTVLLANVNN